MNYNNPLQNINDSFYDNDTRNILVKTLTIGDNEYIQSINENLDKFLLSRWNMIIHSLPGNYILEYSSLPTQELKNKWFQKYIDLESHDMSLMPETLL